MARTFDRWRPLWKQSWAFRRFKNHHTELNDMLWCRAPLNGIAHFKLKGAGPAEDVAALLHVDPAHRDARRVPPTVRAWKAAHAESENWSRLCCLMSALAYLELYVATIVRLSLLSNPGILIGAGRAVDGLGALKRGIPLDTSAAEIDSTRGPWSARLVTLEKRFGVTLPVIRGNLSSLERFRILRNSVGHFFGRDEQSVGLGVLSRIDERIVRVSEAVLNRCLRLVLEVAAELDDCIATPNIGDFELLVCLHNLKKGHRPDVKGDWFVPGEPAITLKRLLGTIKQPSPSKEYCRAALRYYNAQ